MLANRSDSFFPILTKLRLLHPRTYSSSWIGPSSPLLSRFFRCRRSSQEVVPCPSSHTTSEQVFLQPSSVLAALAFHLTAFTKCVNYIFFTNSLRFRSLCLNDRADIEGPVCICVRAWLWLWSLCVCMCLCVYLCGMAFYLVFLKELLWSAPRSAVSKTPWPSAGAMRLCLLLFLVQSGTPIWCSDWHVSW